MLARWSSVDVHQVTQAYRQALRHQPLHGEGRFNARSVVLPFHFVRSPRWAMCSGTTPNIRWAVADSDAYALKDATTLCTTTQGTRKLVFSQ